jgi:cytochrome c peroxidase
MSVSNMSFCARRTSRRLISAGVSVTATLLSACGGDASSATAPVVPPVVVNTEPVRVVVPHAAVGAVAGSTFSYDATKSSTGVSAFTDPRSSGLSYAVTFSPSASGLTVSAGRISGTPASPGIISVTVTATDASGSSASTSFPVIAFSADLVAPSLPGALLAYADARSPLPAHFSANGAGGGSVIATDNMPAANPTTDAGATLGRVLFYDRRVSVNDRVSCASCHQQQFGFADTARLSRGFAGGSTGRHSMGLANARFYQNGRFFWDERAATLEAQTLQPIQDATEMGMTLDNLTAKLALTSFYPALFQAAFGTTDITSDRIGRALAQFVRSMVSGTSTFDRAFAGQGPPNFNAVFTPEELAGQALFNGPAGCARCHGTNGHIGDGVHNTGLDASITDVGAGGGRFKSPSLRNTAVRAPYMHDGRFRSLEAVVDFYDSGVQNNPNLDPRLRGPGGQVQRLGLDAAQKANLVAYMRTLTDTGFLTNAKFANPFAR